VNDVDHSLDLFGCDGPGAALLSQQVHHVCSELLAALRTPTQWSPFRRLTRHLEETVTTQNIDQKKLRVKNCNFLLMIDSKLKFTKQIFFFTDQLQNILRFFRSITNRTCVIPDL
jgi:hypothetical protein